MKNLLKQSAKSLLISLGLTAAASETDEAIHKKLFGSGNTTLIIFNEKVNDVIKMIKSLEQSGLLIKLLAKQIKMKSKGSKQQGGRFLGMLFVRLGASLLGNLLTGKETISAGEGTSRSGQNC